MATELTEEQIAGLEAHCRREGRFGYWDSVARMITERRQMREESAERQQRIQALEERIENQRKELASLQSNYKQATWGWTHWQEKARELEPLAAIGQAAIRLYDCQCEFEEDEGCCSEWRDMLESLIVSHKDGYEVRAIASGQNDPMGAEG